MDTWTLLITLCCGVAIAQSFFLGTYLLAKNKSLKTPQFFLALMLLSLALRIGKSFFYYVLEDFPNYGTILGAIGVWAIGPSFYLYTKSSKPTTIQALDYLHYLPSVLILIGTSLVPQPMAIYYHYGILSIAFYLLWSWYIFKFQDWAGNRKRFQLFSISMSLIGGCFFVQSFVGGIEVYALGSAVASLILYGVNFLILQNPVYLRSGKPNGKKVAPTQQSSIATALNKLFQHEKIYRQKGLTLAVVSKNIGFPTYQVSQTINQHFGLKFNEFVNKYRVAEVKNRLQDSEANDKIEVIAKEVGFASTSSLYTAFKKEVQLTPQAFRKQANG